MWIEPKTNWISSPNVFFNIEDYNRIFGNCQYLLEKFNAICGHFVPYPLDLAKTEGSLIYKKDFVNLINNINEMRTYFGNSTSAQITDTFPNTTRLNYIERYEKDLKKSIEDAIAQKSQLRSLPLSLGNGILNGGL